MTVKGHKTQCRENEIYKKSLRSHICEGGTTFSALLGTNPIFLRSSKCPDNMHFATSDSFVCLQENPVLSLQIFVGVAWVAA